MYDIVALGELLVDFTDFGVTERGNLAFEANPGGAPCNVLAMAAKQGKKTAFLGKVGEDLFGHFLAESLDQAGICRSGLVRDTETPTTLAFVKNRSDGEREFRFYRNPGADEMLTEGEVRGDLLRDTRAFHFGSLSMTREPARSATKLAVREAKMAGAWISFDPNLRRALWKDLDEAREEMLWGCGMCDSLKVSGEELTFLTGEVSSDRGAQALLEQFPQLRLLLITHGGAGSEAYADGCHVRMPAYQVATVDTTGAGDAFCGGCLCWLLDRGTEQTLDEESLKDMLDYANAAASLVTTRYGAGLSMPTPDEIQALRASGK